VSGGVDDDEKVFGFGHANLCWSSDFGLFRENKPKFELQQLADRLSALRFKFAD